MWNRVKNDRWAGVAVVTAIYVLAGVVGVVLYRRLPYDLWLNLLLADVAATVVVFAFSVALNNASVYDPYWSVQPPVILLAFALGKRLFLSGLLLLVAVWLWGVRLTANWVYTFNGFQYEDWRYKLLRQQTGVWYPLVNFLGIHMVPTLVVYGCLLPAVLVIEAGVPANAGSVAFFVLAIGCVLLQGTADVQMHRFRRKGSGELMQEGLWQYARHPNYLAEISIWWCVGLSAVCVLPFRWYLLAGAIANTVLFLTVSIPMADNRQSRKAGYEEYRSRTRMLLPIKK